MNKCPKCPVPKGTECLATIDPDRLGCWCEWAAEDPTDPVKIAHIVGRSEQAAGKEPPGFVERAMNFGKAVVEHVAAGMPTLDEAATEARLAVCRACQHYRDGPCMVCGCNMLIKARWAEQECPEQKWPR